MWPNAKTLNKSASHKELLASSYSKVLGVTTAGEKTVRLKTKTLTPQEVSIAASASVMSEHWFILLKD